MANVSIKINLKQFKHKETELTRKDGTKVKCLIIPIEENMLFEGEKGTYLNLTAIEIKNKVGDSKDTHLIKQDIPKDKYDVMTDEEKRAFPIVGNAIYWGGFKEREPLESQNLSDDDIDSFNNGGIDDLPF
jgi:hypothetical protein